MAAAAAAMPRCLAVSGAGSPHANGVYQRVEGVLHEACPVYESLGGYHMSVTCRPEDGSGRMLWGWVIGRKLPDGTGAMPVYACPTDAKTEIPPDGWQCFEGSEPSPEVQALGGDDADGLAEAYAREARTAAMTSDLRRASEAFARSLRGGPALAADWGRRAELHAATAKVSHMREKFDLALRDVDAALRLKPDFAPALLLRAQILRETCELYDAALSAKQCWLILRHEIEDGSLAKGMERAVRDCERLLVEIGEGADSSLPGRKEAEEATEQEPAPQALERVLSVDILDCGTAECRGVYEPTRLDSNGEPIFENVRGFKLSLEVLPVKGSGEAKYGWVIGRGRQGYYGARGGASGASRRPPGDGWRSFGRGEPPPPRCLVRSAPSSAPALEGRAALRQGRTEEAVELLTRALEQPGAQRSDMLGRAAMLVDLAVALRESGELSEAGDRAREAVGLWPRLEEAFLEEARILEAAGEVVKAAEALQRLLTMRPAHERAAAQLLALSRQEPSAKEWLRHHQAVETLAAGVAGPGSAEAQGQEQPAEDGNVPKEQADLELAKKLRAMRARKAPQVFENKDSEVHACWTLPSREVGAGELRVEMQVQHLTVSVKGVAVFDEDLAHRIKPSESSWAYTAPDLTMVLCKCMDRGAWPKWDTLHRESLDEREARLAGMPFDQNELLWA